MTVTSFMDLTKFSVTELQTMAVMDQKEREKTIKGAMKEKYTVEEVLRIEPMTLGEEMVAMLIFLFGVPGAVFTLPILLLALGYVTQNFRLVFTIGAVLGASLAFWPTPFIEQSLTSWAALQVLRYFSFKSIIEEPLSKDKSYILVAPPHGVFPFGNIVCMIAFPSFMGFAFRGLAASAALRMPMFRQLLGTIGVTEAYRHNAEKASRRVITRCSLLTLLLNIILTAAEKGSHIGNLHRRRC